MKKKNIDQYVLQQFPLIVFFWHFIYKYIY